jgi:hypothetical protein
MTSLFGPKFERIADKYGIVENHSKEERSGEPRFDETKRGSPRGGSESWLIARVAIASR